MNYPKFEEAIKNKIVTPMQLGSKQPGYGLVLAYNPESNLATVLMAQPGTDTPGEIFHNVPCPVTLGVQSVAPETGRPCWVMFRDGTQSTPMITHYFSMSYSTNDFARQNQVDSEIPRFMMDL